MDPTDIQPDADDPYKELPIKDFSYINNSEQPPKKSSKKPLLIIICIIVIILAAGGTFLALHNKKSTDKNSQSTSSSNSQTRSSPTSVSVPTTSYASSTFNLSVNYPKSWSVVDNQQNLMTITSGVMNLTSVSNKSVSGKIIVSVQPQGQVPAAFGTGDGTAVIASQLISYTGPTQSQRAKTYVSFVQYQSTTAVGGLDAVYITGNNGYVKAQDIPRTDLVGLNPLVSVTFVECSTAACTSPTSLTISSSSWNNATYKNLILNILKSFAFS